MSELRDRAVAYLRAEEADNPDLEEIIKDFTELYDQMTGRKMFYNPDGSIMRIGADEPCPCGSGKKYRECCGM